MEADANLKIAELERRSSEEVVRYNHLNSQSELAKLEATQEVEHHKRVSLMDRETVARLQQDNKTLRERETRDREVIARQEEECRTTRAREIRDRGSVVNALMKEMEKKDGVFREKLSEMKAETIEWKNKYCGLSKLIDETVAEFATKEREFKEKCVKLEEENRDLKARLLRVPEENCPGHIKRASEMDEDLMVLIVDSHSEDDNDDRVPLSHLTKKRLAEACERGKKDLDHSSMASGVKETSFDEEDVQIPLGSAIKTEEENHEGTSSMKKFKKSDLSCLSVERGSAGRSCVTDRGSQSNGKRNTSKKTYAGRTPSSEQRELAEEKARVLRRSLRSCNPSFIKSMASSHISGSFWFSIPVQFCKDNLPAQDMKIILEDEQGLEHTVNYIYRRTAFSGGWGHFAVAHKLELGDTLIFELHEPARFKVYIIKAIPDKLRKNFDLKVLSRNIHGTDKWTYANGTENQDVDLSNV